LLLRFLPPASAYNYNFNISEFIKQGKGKGKVAPALFLTEHHAMKVYWGVEV